VNESNTEKQLFCRRTKEKKKERKEEETDEEISEFICRWGELGGMVIPWRSNKVTWWCDRFPNLLLDRGSSQLHLGLFLMYSLIFMSAHPPHSPLTALPTQNRNSQRPLLNRSKSIDSLHFLQLELPAISIRSPLPLESHLHKKISLKYRILFFLSAKLGKTERILEAFEVSIGE